MITLAAASDILILSLLRLILLLAHVYKELFVKTLITMVDRELSYSFDSSPLVVTATRHREVMQDGILCLLRTLILRFIELPRKLVDVHVSYRCHNQCSLGLRK